MAGTSLRLLIVLLSVSHLICLNAIPLTRTRNLEHESLKGYGLSKDFHLANAKRSWNVERVVRRMDIDLHDYPGSGANNRHTPRPQLGRGCVDC